MSLAHRTRMGARALRPHAALRPITGLQGGGFWGSPCVPSSVSGIRTPNLPLLPVWEKGAGGMRGKRRGNAANRASRPRTLPLRAITGARAQRDTSSLTAWVRGRPRPPGCAGTWVRGRPRPHGARASRPHGARASRPYAALRPIPGARARRYTSSLRACNSASFCSGRPTLMRMQSSRPGRLK